MATDAQRRSFLESTLDPSELADAAATGAPRCETCGGETHHRYTSGRSDVYECSTSKKHPDVWVDSTTGKVRR
ncbi:MAG TPA: hypothetical protein VGG74_21080 [Kofleriaceae bacterium]|jgi:hypothetical protein